MRSRISGNDFKNIRRLLLGRRGKIPPDELPILEKKRLPLGKTQGLGDSERRHDDAIFIGKEIKGQLVFIFEGLLRIH